MSRHDYTPDVPPRVAAQMPRDPFEAWLVKQAAFGHDKQWLQRNKEVLRKRWEGELDPEHKGQDLPPPEPKPEKPYDRYSEI